jgi:hypothetical protein
MYEESTEDQVKEVALKHLMRLTHWTNATVWKSYLRRIKRGPASVPIHGVSSN